VRRCACTALQAADAQQMHSIYNIAWRHYEVAQSSLVGDNLHAQLCWQQT
jgi:hypothetical protein